MRQIRLPTPGPGSTDRLTTAGGLGDGEVAWLSWPMDLLDQARPGETQPNDPYGFAEWFTTEASPGRARSLVARACRLRDVSPGRSRLRRASDAGGCRSLPRWPGGPPDP